MTATIGWKRNAPGSYTRGKFAIRRESDPRHPDRPWVLYRATTLMSVPWAPVGRFHTLKLAQIAAQRRTR